MADQPDRRAAVAASRNASPRSWLRESASNLFIAAGDAIFAFLIVIAGLTAWSPRIGVEAAREAVAARRKRRAMISELRGSGGAVWARQARRNAAFTLGRSSLSIGRPRIDG